MPTTAVAARKVGGRPKGSLGDRTWRDAIEMAVRELREETMPDGKVKKVRALRLLARRLVDCGLEGDVTALRELGDRLDGKATLGVGLKMDVTITGIERRIIDVTPGAAGELIEVEAVEGEAVEGEQPVTNLLPNDAEPEADKY